MCQGSLLMFIFWIWLHQGMMLIEKEVYDR